MVAGIPQEFRGQRRIDIVVEDAGGHVPEHLLVIGSEVANVEGHSVS
jgi:hypothetical protein